MGNRQSFIVVTAVIKVVINVFYRRVLCIVFKDKGAACRKAVKVIFIVIEA